MEKINIKIDIDNKEKTYKYEGIAKLNKDIVTYSDNDFDYIYDLKINRFVKYNKDSKIVLDFDKEEIVIDDKFIIEIKVKKREIDDNKRNIIYNVDNNEIKFKFIMRGDLNE